MAKPGSKNWAWVKNALCVTEKYSLLSMLSDMQGSQVCRTPP